MIWIIEDEEWLRELYDDHARQYGYDVRIVEPALLKSGRIVEVIATADGECTGLVVDAILKGCQPESGPAIVRALRERKITLPIVGCSSLTLAQGEFFEAGVNVFVCKTGAAPCGALDEAVKLAS
jgi:DNA-binding response OmpR family regulator